MTAYLVVLAFVAGLGLPISVIFASTAQGKATVAALEGITRQPESAPSAQLSLIIGLSLIEALVIYALLIFFLLMGKLPSVNDVVQMSWVMSKAQATAIPAQITDMAAAPASIPANGEATSTITLTLKDASGKNLAGQNVTMKAEGGGTISSPAEDNGDGTYAATYVAGGTPGKVTIEAGTPNGVSGEVSLTLQ